jgi:hypothetical protein
MRQLLNTAIVFRKHIISLIFIVFTCWASFNSYKEYKDIENLEKILSIKISLSSAIKKDVGEIYKEIAALFEERDILISSDQKFSLLKKEQDKSFLNIDYEVYMRNDFLDSVELLEKMAEKNLVQKISEITIEKKNDEIDDLDIKLKFKALAYDKIN